MEHGFSCRLKGDYGHGVCGKVEVEKEYCERPTLAWPERKRRRTTDWEPTKSGGVYYRAGWR